jgi:hypothetical protein
MRIAHTPPYQKTADQANPTYLENQRLMPYAEAALKKYYPQDTA